MSTVSVEKMATELPVHHLIQGMAFPRADQYQHLKRKEQQRFSRTFLQSMPFFSVLFLMNWRVTGWAAQVRERWEVASHCDPPFIVLVRVLVRFKGSFCDKKMSDFYILRGEIKPIPLISIKMLPVSSYLFFTLKDCLGMGKMKY